MSTIPPNSILQGDALEILKTLPDESIDCVITSPPYWSLRDYGVPGQLGLEPTFEEYITKLCDIFDEVKRVLKKEGTCWINMGDTYYGGGRIGNTNPGALSKIQRGNRGMRDVDKATSFKWSMELPAKSLCQIPSRFAIEMARRGWILRNEIIWHKPNVMPTSANDRFTVDFEKVYFFVKTKKYHFEQQFEPYAPTSDVRYRQALRADRCYTTKQPYINNIPYHKNLHIPGQSPHGMHKVRMYKRWQGSVSSRGDNADGLVVGGFNPQGRNMRTVWRIPTKPFRGAHFATFPEALVEPMITAGCPKGGIVCDPFFGAGTTGLAAKKFGRFYIGIELNTEYIQIAEERIKDLDRK